MKLNSVIGATALLAASMLSGTSVYHPQHHAGSKSSRMFDLASIMHARKNNQRNKNQRRLRGRN